VENAISFLPLVGRTPVDLLDRQTAEHGLEGAEELHFHGGAMLEDRDRLAAAKSPSLTTSRLSSPPLKAFSLSARLQIQS